MGPNRIMSVWVVVTSILFPVTPAAASWRGGGETYSSVSNNRGHGFVIATYMYYIKGAGLSRPFLDYIYLLKMKSSVLRYSKIVKYMEFFNITYR